MASRAEALSREAQQKLLDGDPAAARALVLGALGEQPGHFESSILLELCAMALGEGKDGLARLRPLVARHADFPGFYRLLGDMLMQARAVVAATDLYRESLATQPSAEGWLALARCLVRQVDGRRIGLYVEIAEAARAALAIAPDAWNGHYLLGLALIWQSRPEEAELALRRAIELNPQFPDAPRRLADILLGRGDFAAALPLWKKVAALVPEDGEARQAIETCMAAEGPKKNERKRAFGRTPTTLEAFADLEQAVRETILPEYRGMAPIISPRTRILTMGSCFAGNVARVLESLGTSCTYLGLGEGVNSTFANRALLEWVSGGGSPATNHVLRSLFPDGLERLPALFREVDIVIYTLGVAPCFFDSVTGEFLLSDGQPTSALALARKARFRTTSVAENVDNLHALVTMTRAFNPAARFVFTVSPVSLAASFERASAVIADCVSKSVLRAAIEEFLNAGVPGTYYWPAFEIVRWLGAFHPGVYGEEDGSTLHVSERVVAMIMRLFLETFGERELAPATAA